MKHLLLAAAAAWTLAAQAQSNMSYANRYDQAAAGTYEARERDWRNGAISYQVLVDRFAPSADLQAKKALYPPPKRLRGWDELPTAGPYLEKEKVAAHEIDFWGGDLHSLAGRLDYIEQLGAGVLYLNPIDLAYTNHKYDTLDYKQVSPEYGTRDDVKKLAAELHRRGMKLVLDGVFNHMGRNAPIFQQAQADPKSPYRDWFVFGPQYAGGARGWWNVQNLPELNLENPQVRAYLWGDPDSVVRGWLRDGIDGWRLDVAFDIGFRYLQELTDAAHAEKPGSLVVGEIANYPREWYPSVDGILHFTLRQIMLRTAAGEIDAPTAARMVQRMVADAGIENMLKSWIYLDNHDTERLATALPDARQRHLAQVLQFTLPGAPNLYYGGELDMAGGGDPAMRAPMRWDLVREGYAPLAWTKQLVRLHREQRALRIGDFRLCEATRLLAFERHTDRAADTVIVLMNTSAAPVTETVLLTNSKLMDGTRMVDLLDNPGSPAPEPLRIASSLLKVTLPAHGFRVLRPDVAPPGGYTNYKRVQ